MTKPITLESVVEETVLSLIPHKPICTVSSPEIDDECYCLLEVVDNRQEIRKEITSKFSRLLYSLEERVEGMKEYRHLDLPDSLVRKLDVKSLIHQLREGKE